MATLESVMQMKQQGIPDPQIIQTLQQQGISPKEINEALSQSKIKTELVTTPNASFPGTTPTEAISAQPIITPPQGIPENPQQMPQTFIQETPTQMQGMQPSMMTTPETPMPEVIPTQEMRPPTMPSTPEMYPSYQAPQEMPYYEEYQPQQSADIETINDIAEQIVEEKTNTFKKQITDFVRFKDELSLEVNKINERLLRIENTFNQLQIAILGKIGDYGKDIQNIAKEMHDTQDSFSKIINPLTDNIRALQKITKSSPRKTIKSKKSSNEFENYLR